MKRITYTGGSRWIKKASLPLLALPLTGCLQIQLFGTVSDADVIIEPLAQPGSVVYEGSSTGRDASIDLYGEEQWTEWGPLLQIHLLGLVTTGKTTEVSDDELYLVTATNGYDEDASDRDGAVDTIGTLISTPLHAILTGAQIKGRDGKVSALTELAYQAVLSEGDPSSQSAADVSQALDELSASLVDDLNGDGSVNYSDLLQWSYIGGGTFKGDSDLLDSFGEALLAGASTGAELQAMANEILGDGPVALNPASGTWRFTIERGNEYCANGTGGGIGALPAQEFEIVIAGDEATAAEGYFPPLPGWDITASTTLTGSYYEPLNSLRLRQVLTGYADEALVNSLQEVNLRITSEIEGDTITGTLHYDYLFRGPLCEVDHRLNGTKVN